jgi:hypothetical protein
LIRAQVVIGETIAKLFSAFDAKVVINYFHGGADAERIVEEIVSNGGDAFVSRPMSQKDSK